MPRTNDFTEVANLSDSERQALLQRVPAAKFLWGVLVLAEQKDASRLLFTKTLHEPLKVGVWSFAGRDSIDALPDDLQESVLDLLGQMAGINQLPPAVGSEVSSIRFPWGNNYRACEIVLDSCTAESAHLRMAFWRHLKQLLLAVIHRQQEEEVLVVLTMPAERIWPGSATNWKAWAWFWGSLLGIRLFGEAIGWLPIIPSFLVE